MADLSQPPSSTQAVPPVRGGVVLSPAGTFGTSFSKVPPSVMRAMTWLNVVMFRLLGKRVRIQGRPLLLLTTVGAKTGKKRQTPLGWFPDTSPGQWLIVASAAGSARHPAWFINLAKNQDNVWIETQGRTYKVHARTLSGAEREEGWARVVKLAPGYGQYQHKTDRRIPLVSLSPADQ